MGKKEKEAAASEAGLEDKAGRPAKSVSGGRLTPIDIQQVEFRRAFKGYDEREVDEFLDRLTEDLAAALDENQRLRERLDAGIGASDPTEANRQADEILRRAREEAARIAADARVAASSAGQPPEPVDRAEVRAYLLKEREFLRELAAVVQAHAEGVKAMARETQGAARREEPAAAASSQATEPSAPQRPDATQQMASQAGEAAAPSHGEPIQIPEPEPERDPAAVKREASDRPETSLRELFWGEE